MISRSSTSKNIIEIKSEQKEKLFQKRGKNHITFQNSPKPQTKTLIHSFREQKIKGFYFVPSFCSAMVCNLVVAFVLVLLGSVHLFYVLDLKEVFFFD